jgi:hypothetical protein
LSSAKRTEAILRIKLQNAESINGAESVGTAFCLLDLGDFLELGSRFDEALFCYFRAARLYKLLGDDHRLLHALALKSAAEMPKITGRDARAYVIKRQVRKIVFEYKELGFS